MTVILDPRSSSTQVHAWLAQDLSDAAVRAGLAVLAADPNWLLRQTPGPTAWDVALCYSPEGAWRHVTLRRQTRPDGDGDGVWRHVPAP